ncbi:MAG: hypothetical protein IJD66_06160 [Methanocorpusculum sp.]|nr:hypothetical protein [Methanocorpusculum sp.]HJJ66000.1 hypothetical protein [Methanocorpusculum sp.]
MKSPKKFNKIFLAILAVSIIMLFIGMASENIPLLGFALLIAFGSFIFRAITFRCPYCGYYLGRRSGTYCPRCKKDIE